MSKNPFLNNPNEYSDVLKDTIDAFGLKNDHYIKKSKFLKEKENLFFNEWSALCFSSDLNSVGYVKALKFLGLPLIVVKDKTKKIRVFQNTCRHRGMILFEKSRKLKSSLIVCPYHSWSYSLDGKLLKTPLVGGANKNHDEGIDCKNLSLYEIKCHEWLGIVFINVNKNKDRFDKVHFSLINRWREFNQKLYFSKNDSEITFNLKCNWKLAVENYCDAYHLPWVHPSLNQYSRLEDHYEINDNYLFSGQGSYHYETLSENNLPLFSNFKNLSKKWKLGAEYISLFPNVLLGVHCDHIFSIILEPKSLKKTRERIRIFYSSEKMISKEMHEKRKKNTERWKKVFEEDVFAVEGMQKGRDGKFFDGGKFSKSMDGPTHTFHKWVSNLMKI